MIDKDAQLIAAEAPITCPRVGVVLLNYGRPKETLACLRSLKPLDYPAFEVWVVDNASPDDSLSVLSLAQGKPDYPPFHLIASPRNGGYSAGNNLAIEAILAENFEYVWLLNNDTTVGVDTLSPLVAMAEETRGLVGSLLRYPDGTYQRVGTRLRWWTGGVSGVGEGDVRDGMSLENLTGASMLIPTSVIRRIGLLNDDYFLYFEDGEYCLRAQRAGYSCRVCPQSVVLHEEGATTGKSSLRTQYYYHRNRLLMYMTYANPLQQVTISLYTLFRLGRSIMKSIGAPSDASREDSLRVQWLALRDYFQGVRGPCPHPL